MAKKENAVESAPTTSTVSSRTANVLGIEYTLTGVPTTVEEYDTAAGRIGACLDRAVDAQVAHRFNSQARGAVVEAVQAALKAQHGEGYSVPEQGELSEDAYIKKLKEDGVIDAEFLKSLPPIEIEFSLTSTRSSGPGKKFLEAATAAINQFGSADEVAKRLSEGGYPCQADEKSIAAAFKKKFEDAQKEAMAI